MSEETVEPAIPVEAPEPPAVEPMPEPLVFVGSSRVESQEVLASGKIKVVLHEPQGVPPVLTFTPEQFEAVKSATPYEDGQISVRKWRMCVAMMIKLLLDNDMQMGDMSFVLTRLRDSIQTNFDKAVGKKFEVTDQDFISLHQIDEVLKSS